MRLLLLEDEDTLAGLVAAGLGQAGFSVDRAASLAEAGDMAGLYDYDAMIFDRGLPDGDALGLLRDLRRRKCAVPVLVLTARDAVEDRIEGLNTGADDYLAKPFALSELVARLRALLRRPALSVSPLIGLGNLLFDPGERVASADGRPLSLSPLECNALEILLRRSGKVVRRAQLEHGLYDADTIIGSNTIEVLMHRLRRKLELAQCDCMIVTVRGLGYLLQPAS
ncbi:response regulator [Zavarzinia aquatilis]|uniref:DNA-binding response regulator n=1 Tax=Zavarzinia aquatilis TaxID=2211142 RepID=A0A317E5W6_9PROT|nr:response regulator transcription factor [Zavarzinia aquatilis]PWR20415.1 DNA-binding response regulator [Zavarzinia aquatilis]